MDAKGALANAFDVGELSFEPTEVAPNLFAMAMGAGMTADNIKGMIFAYPSYASDIGSMV